MYVVGTVAEYNPLHKGHAYQVNTTRQKGATHIVTVLGSSFTQRGDVALLSKSARCKAAIHAGSDLVIELPVVRTLSPAQWFARGGMELLSSLGVVDGISFGCECGDADALVSAARAADSTEIKGALDGYLAQGLTFAAARQAAVEAVFGKDTAALLASPNNILATEYISAAERIGAGFDYMAVPRKGAGHDSLDEGEFLSASAIRAICAKDVDAALPHLPDFSGEILQAQADAGRLATIDRLESAILCKLKMMRREDFGALPDISEGLENRIYDAAQAAVTLEGLYTSAKTKRYTLARIRRIVLCAFLGLTRDLAEAPLPYIRVLGFSEKGAELLHLAREKATLPIVMKPAAVKGDPVMEMEDRATQMFNMACETPANNISEYTTQIYKKGV